MTRQRRHIRNARLDKVKQLRIRVAILADQRKMIANTKVGLEEQRRAHRAQHAFRHDCNAVAQNVRFVHRMRREHNHTSSTALLNQPPDVAPRERINPAAWLIEIHHLGAPNKGQRHTQLALHAAAQIRSQRVRLLRESNLAHLDMGLAINICGSNTLDPRKQPQMLEHSQLVKQNVVLRAEPGDLANRINIINHRAVKHKRIARGRRRHARQHRNRRGLASTIVAQQAEHIAFVHVQRELVHRAHGRRITLKPRECLAEAAHTHSSSLARVVVLGLADRPRIAVVGTLHQRRAVLGVGAAALLAAPVARHKAEPGALSGAKLARNHLVEIPGQDNKEQKVDKEHQQHPCEREVAVANVGPCDTDAIDLALRHNAVAQAECRRREQTGKGLESSRSRGPVLGRAVAECIAGHGCNHEEKHGHNACRAGLAEEGGHAERKGDPRKHEKHIEEPEHREVRLCKQLANLEDDAHNRHGEERERNSGNGPSGPVDPALEPHDLESLADALFLLKHHVRDQEADRDHECEHHQQRKHILDRLCKHIDRVRGRRELAQHRSSEVVAGHPVARQRISFCCSGGHHHLGCDAAHAGTHLWVLKVEMRLVLELFEHQQSSIDCGLNGEKSSLDILLGILVLGDIAEPLLDHKLRRRGQILRRNTDRVAHRCICRLLGIKRGHTVWEPHRAPQRHRGVLVNVVLQRSLALERDNRRRVCLAIFDKLACSRDHLHDARHIGLCIARERTPAQRNIHGIRVVERQTHGLHLQQTGHLEVVVDLGIDLCVTDARANDCKDAHEQNGKEHLNERSFPCAALETEVFPNNPFQLSCSTPHSYLSFFPFF
eukprot:comp22263_c0_seq1/m.53007 comp22263_c0_seq1/g.53007  ORF comp22263_c0_seq1/g.53007 comp22263_c0_seq1/m.53007 type:complete len:834 (-) comp22263_c0_seq1:9-2510(-)